jgi:hypothetical protein
MPIHPSFMSSCEHPCTHFPHPTPLASPIGYEKRYESGISTEARRNPVLPVSRDFAPNKPESDEPAMNLG